MRQGVKYIFATDGSLVDDISKMIHGASYICSSTMMFKALEYKRHHHLAYNGTFTLMCCRVKEASSQTQNIVNF